MFNKLNMMINKLILKNICVHYKNIRTGNSIYLFDIHDKKKIDGILYFDIYAYSFCPIDNRIQFNIYFDNHTSYCFFNESKNYFYKTNINEKNSLIASCYMKYKEKVFDYYFPSAKSKENIILNIYNYRRYLTMIFKDFFCLESDNCILKVILLEKIYYNYILTTIDDEKYLCNLDEIDSFSTNKYPIVKTLRCTTSNYGSDVIKFYLSGIPLNISKTHTILDNNIIPKQFILSRIVTTNESGKNEILFIGKLLNNLEQQIYNFSLNLFYPKMSLNCFLKPNSKYVQSIIHCFNEKEINSQILIENQVTQSLFGQDELLLINEETLIRINFYINFIVS